MISRVRRSSAAEAPNCSSSSCSCWLELRCSLRNSLMPSARAPGLFTHADDFLDHQRRAEQRFQYRILAALDAPGDFDLSFACEQRDHAHFPQIHAYGVVDLFANTGRQFEIEEVFAFIELLFK